MQNIKDSKKLLIGGISYIILGSIMLIVFIETIRDLLLYESNYGFDKLISILPILLLEIVIPILLVICGISIIRKKIITFSIVTMAVGVLYLLYYASQPIVIIYNTAGFNGWFDFFIKQNNFGYLYISVILQSTSFILMGIIALLKTNNKILACIPVVDTVLAIILLIVFCFISNRDINPARYFTLTGHYPTSLYIIENIVKVLGFALMGFEFCNASIKNTN